MTSQSNSTIRMDDETYGVALEALESQILSLQGQIDDVKDQIKSENTAVRDQRRSNAPVVNTTNIEYLRKSLAIKKSQIKKVRSKKEKLEKDGILEEDNNSRPKKSTDREKILRLKEKLKKNNVRS